LGKTPLVVVQAEGVTLTDFALRGNTDTVEQVDRAPLLSVRAGGFLIENGTFRDSSKDGVEVHGGEGRTESIAGGVLRNLTGYNIGRDAVSLSGDAGGELPLRDILVENIRCFGSPRRGAVEVSDGTRNITVRKVYAEDCVYAVDIQDHGERGQVNHNVVVEDVYASRCQFAIRMAVRPFGHRNITLKDVTAENCLAPPPLRLNHVEQLSVSNVRVADYTGESPITVTNCDGVILRDVIIDRAQLEDAAVRIEDCNQVFVSGVIVRGGTNGLTGIVKYRVASNETFSGLHIEGVLSSAPKVPALVVENTSDRGRLENAAGSDSAP
jgi:hypothetical protein